MTEAHKQRNKRSYLKKVSEQRCVTCGKQDERTLTGRVYCQSCLDRHKKSASPRKKRTPEQQEYENANRREWEKRMKALQMCTRCGAKDKRTTNGYSLCVICAAKKNKRQREKWDSAKNSEYLKARRDNWRKQGKCTNCGGKREEPNKMLCIDCRVRARLQRQRRDREKGERDGKGYNT